MNKLYLYLIACGFFCLWGLESNAKTNPMDKIDHHLKAKMNHVSSSVFQTTLSKGAATQDEWVYLYARLHEPAEHHLDLLRSVGLKNLSYFGGLVSGSIQLLDIETLASLDVVSTIFPYQQPLNYAFEGEGVQSLKADIVRSTYGFDGSGIKVGVISNSFTYISNAEPVIADIDNDGILEVTGTDSQLSGDLPDICELIKDVTELTVDGMTFTEAELDDEGRAMSEVVSDIASGADIAFHTGLFGIADTAQAMVRLAEAGCTVIVDDQGFFGQPIFQAGEMTQAIQHVSENYGVVHVNAIGNSGAKNISGNYHDIDPNTNDPAELPTDPNLGISIPLKHDLHNWNPILRTPQPDPYLDITLPAGSGFSIFVYWLNPFSGTLGEGASTDYDFYVLTEPDLKGSAVIGAGVNVQGTPDAPFGDPVENEFVLNNSDETKTYYIAMNLRKGLPVPFHIILVHNPRFTVAVQGDVRTTDGSQMFGHAKSPYSLGIAAVNFIENDMAGGFLGNPFTIEPTYYSSRGGLISIYYESDGTPLSTPMQYWKPDIASVDGVNTSFFTGSGGDYGFDTETELPNFLGTSAASPHAAGVVALMRHANPELTSEEIRRLARLAATDIASPGVDADTGWGLLYADQAIQMVLSPSTTVEDWMNHEFSEDYIKY